MNKNFITGLITGFCLFGIVSISHATPLLNIVEGTPSISGSLPLNGTHDVDATAGAVGWYNANLFALENVNLTYEYLGFEAGWTNAFLVDNNIAFQNKDFGGFSASTEGDNFLSSAAPGSLLDFAFEILAGGNAGYFVENGSNVEPMGTPNNPDNGYSAPNFFLGYADDSHNSVFIALDDGGGPHWTLNTLADDNHDDLVIKVTATAVSVPEPATMLLFCTGLLGLAGIRRRKKA